MTRSNVPSIERRQMNNLRKETNFGIEKKNAGETPYLISKLGSEVTFWKRMSRTWVLGSLGLAPVRKARGNWTDEWKGDPAGWAKVRVGVLEVLFEISKMGLFQVMIISKVYFLSAHRGQYSWADQVQSQGISATYWLMEANEEAKKIQRI